MMKWKRFAAPIAAAAVILAATGCAAQPANTEQTGDDQLKIVATMFPQYDWVRQILGDKQQDVQLTLLLDDGVDLHSYQPTAEDMIRISDCDLFIYVGGPSDEKWVEDVLAQSKNPDLQALSLVELLGDGIKEEEFVQGMEHVHEEEDDHDHEEEEDHSHGIDEHVWLSLKNAQLYCDAIAQAMAAADPQNAQTYQNNAEAYITQLGKLDAEYQQAVDSAKGNTLIFADRFPFRYLLDDYGLEYYAAFSGCSAETEASFETVSFLAQQTEQLRVPGVLTIEGGSQKLAQTVVQNTTSKTQQILAMDSMQSTSLKQAQEGTTYLSVMQDNLEILKQALQGE